MITLFGTGPMFGLPHASPFATKAEVLLKLSGLPYRLAPADMRKAPRGKMPWIDDAGQLVSDSRLIRAHLETRHGVDFSGGYGPREQAMALMAERMLENHLYWFMVENRWLEGDNFARGPVHFFDGLPAPLRLIVPALVRRKVRRDVATEGLNRLTPEEKLLLVRQALAAMAALIGENRYLLGETVCGADATVFAFLDSLECPVFASPYGEEMRRHPVLMGYLERMRAACFPGAGAQPA